MKNYLGFSRDHSGSMRPITKAAARDYNSTIAAVQEAAVANNQDTIVSVVRCGGTVQREVVNSNVSVLRPIPESSYTASGGTPLFESILDLISIMKGVPDYNDPEVTFLIMATTDGDDTGSDRIRDKMLAEMHELNRTDRWTFVFRVPAGGRGRHGYGRDKTALMDNGIPEGNILEWNTTERGLQVAAEQTKAAYAEYSSGRTRGMKSTTKFFANLADVSIADIKTFAQNGQLVDISNEVVYFPVTNKDAGEQIRVFVESQLGGKPMAKGAAFYQLVKTEPKVQANKRIAIRNKTTGAVYAGDAARQMLALPLLGTVRLAPDELGDFEVYIQSTSVNRKLDRGTKILYWDQVGKAFKEGPSARP